MRIRWVVLALLLLATPAHAERRRLTIAMYVPSVGFTQAKDRMQYIEAVASAIESATGVATDTKVFARYTDLAASGADFAIIDALCIAAKSPGRVLATALIDGSPTRTWAVYARAQTTLPAESKATIAYATTGCRDTAFIDEVLLRGEMKVARAFAHTVTKLDVLGAVAATRDYKEADLVVAPSDVASGLVEIVASGPVANPGFVQLDRSLDSALVTKVIEAIRTVTGDVIEGWQSPQSYAALADRLDGERPSLVLAEPSAVVLEAEPMTKRPPGTAALTPLRSRWWSTRVRR